MQARAGTADVPAGSRLGASLLLSSFLVGELKWAGPLLAPRAAAAFLETAGRQRELFLPFFYRWFDDRAWAADQALRLIRILVAREGIVPPRAFHAPFAGRYGMHRGYYRDLADPRRSAEHAIHLARECRFLGRVRRELGIRERLLYVLHLGLRQGRPVGEAVAVAVSALRPAVEVAANEGVVLAIENVADRSGDQHSVGARLPEVEEAILRLHIEGPDAPVGWTFDISHALLGYRGDVGAITTDLRRMLPHLVHLHVNTPRFYPSEEPWADRHEAPTEGFRPLWDLFRTALGSSRFQEFGTVTYEGSWAAPFLNPIVGGSPLAAVVRGYRLVERIAADVLTSLESESVSRILLTVVSRKGQRPDFQSLCHPAHKVLGTANQGQLAQRKSTAFTLQGSQVRILYCPPHFAPHSVRGFAW